MRRVLALQPFRRLALAYGVNSLGTWFGEVALAVLVLRETGSATAVAAVWACSLFVPALVGAALVARVEHLPRRVALPALLAGQAIVFALIVAGVSAFSLPLVLALVTIDGTLGLAARALLRASVVAVTQPADLLEEGNGVLNTLFTVNAAAGPFLAGVTVAVLSPETALLIDAASFALAAGALAWRTAIPQAAAEAGRLRERIAAGLDHVRARPTLRRLLGVTAAVGLLGAAIIPIEVLLVTKTLGASEAGYGTVLALWGAGAVVGSGLVAVVRRVPLMPLLAGSFLLFAVSYLGMGTASSLAAACAFSFLGGIANGVDGFATMTALQKHTADEHQARVGGLVEAVAAAATGAGFLLGGLVAASTSPRVVYVLAGIGLAVLAAAVLAQSRGPIVAPTPQPAD